MFDQLALLIMMGITGLGVLAIYRFRNEKGEEGKKKARSRIIWVFMAWLVLIAVVFIIKKLV